jgi:hypothetical protein
MPIALRKDRETASLGSSALGVPEEMWGARRCRSTRLVPKYGSHRDRPVSAVDQRAALARVPTDGGQELPLNKTLIEVELE